MESLMNRWVWSGIQRNHLRNHLQNISPARITNVLALISFSVLLLQLPINIYFWYQGGEAKSLLILLHCMGLTLVPMINKHHYPLLARIWLIVCYSSYINGSVILFGSSIDMHNFILLGVFVVPFIFPPNQKHYSIMALCLMSANFLAWELEVFPQYQGEISGHYLKIIIQANGISFTLACLLCSAYIIHNVNTSWKKLAEEQQRSEQLLLNILPYPIAQKLKHSTLPVADHFDHATILFADIKGFSELTKSRTPAQLINLLNEIFSTFDELCNHYGLEKIKTIGDEYMAVAGVPTEDLHHARQSCLCALKMQQHFASICKRHKIPSGLRIGLNSGPVIAGVIGIKKFSYDLWGAAVNLASRMESQGESNKVQLSKHTYELVKNDFLFEPPHILQVKGMGATTCHFLIGVKTHDKTQRRTISANALAETT